MNDRKCPICGDPIPATAHRLKKLCGKPECMAEQARISGRKSYNKVNGHTVPEARECIVCHKDITHLRTSRKVCENPECKEVIVKRSKADYYQRNNGETEYEARRRVAAANYRAKHRPRRCQICRDTINHLAPGVRICEKQSCIEYREKLRAQKGQYVAAKTVALKAPKIARTPKPAKIAKPKLNPSYRRKPKPGMGITIRRNSPVKPVYTKEEVKVSTKPTNLPESFPTSSIGISSIVDNGFNDPWDCASCRELLKLCDFHQGMVNDGYKPRKFAL